MKIRDLRTLNEDISWTQLQNKKPNLYAQWVNAGLTKDDFENYAAGKDGGKKFDNWEDIRNYIKNAKNTNSKQDAQQPSTQSDNSASGQTGTGTGNGTSNGNQTSDKNSGPVYRTGYNKDGTTKGFTNGDLDATNKDQNGYKTIKSTETIDAIDKLQDDYLNAFRGKLGRFNPDKAGKTAGKAVADAIDIATDSKAGTNMQKKLGDNFMITFMEGYKWENLKDESNELIPWLRQMYDKGFSVSKDTFKKVYNMYLNDNLDDKNVSNYTSEKAFNELVSNKNSKVTLDKDSLTAWINSLPTNKQDSVRKATQQYIDSLKQSGVDKDFEQNITRVK